MSQQPPARAGAIVRQHRRTKNMTLDELGKAVGVSSRAASYWERGESEPTPDNVRRIDEVLEAGGAIMAAYGILSERGDLSAAIAEMAAEVRRLRAQLAARDEQLDDLTRRIARLEG